MREAKKFIHQSAKPPQINQVLPPSPRRASGFIAGISRERERQLGGKTVGGWRGGAGLLTGPSGVPAWRRRWNVQALASGAAWGAPGESPLAGSAGGSPSTFLRPRAGGTGSRLATGGERP